MLQSRQDSFWPLLLFMLLGIGVPIMPRLQSATASSAAKDAKPDAARAAPAELQAPPERKSSCTDQFERPMRDFGASAGAYTKQSIIVSIADPIDSMSDYHLDRGIDAIHRAAFDAGYVPDRRYLPWLQKRAAEDTTRSQSSAPDPEKDKDKADPSRCSEEWPGRLLFRNDRDKQLLQVLLVGETATWGVQQKVLDRAVDEALKREWADPNRPGNTVRIVGPAFSGSARSMHDVLERYASSHPDRPIRFHIVNGSATSPRTAAVLEGRQSDSDSSYACRSGSSLPRSCVQYESTIPDDEQTLKRFGRYLVERGLAAPFRSYRRDGTNECFLMDVAVLRETGTTYSADIRSLFMPYDPPAKRFQGTEDRYLHTDIGPQACRDQSGRTAASRGVQGSFCRQAAGPEKCTGYLPSLTVEFAAHIAQLRTQHDIQHRSQRRSEKQEQAAAAIELALTQSRDPSEVLPMFSPATASSEDRILASTLSEMCRQEVRYVGIIGTQTLDLVYLAHQVKAYCPNIRLFFLEADILYLHPDYNSHLIGSLVLSPYPLLLQNRAWTWPFDSQVLSQFASTTHLGIYNAVLKHLIKDSAPPLLERLAPFTSLDGDLSDLARNKQPTWLTAVGYESFWPLAVLSRSEPSQQGPRIDCGTGEPPPLLTADASQDKELLRFKAGHEARWVHNATSQWRALMWGLSLMGGALALGYWLRRLWKAERPMPWGFRWAESLPERSELAPTPTRAAFQLLLLIPPTVVYLLAALLTFIESAVAARAGLRCLLPRGQVAVLGTLLRQDLGSALDGGIRLSSWSPVLADCAVLLIAALLLLAVFDVIMTQAVKRTVARLIKRRWLVESTVCIGTLLLLIISLLVWNRQQGINPFSWMAGSAADGRFRSFADPSVVAEATSAILFRERTGNIGSGLSILVPTMLLAAALSLIGFYGLRRLRQRPGRPHFPERDRGPAMLAGIELLTTDVESGARPFAFRWRTALLLLCAAFVMWLPYKAGLRGLEGPEWDLWAWIAAFLIIACVLEAALSFGGGWRDLRTLLVRYSSLPLRRALKHLPLRFSQQLGGLMLARPPVPSELAMPIQQLRQLADSLPADTGAPEWASFTSRMTEQELEQLRSGLALQAQEAERHWQKEIAAYGGRRFDATACPSWAELCAAGTQLLAILVPCWKEGLEAHVPEPTSKDGEPADSATDSIKSSRDWLFVAEVYVSTLLACLVFRAMSNLRYQLVAATGSLLLLLTALMSYPFLRQQTLVLATEVGMAGVAAMALMTFIEMEKNETLSRIHGTPAGKVSWNRALILKIGLFVIIPLFGAIAADVPAIGRSLVGVALAGLQLLQ